MSPKRLQRTRDFKKPRDAVYVNRPTKWHNPFAKKIIPGWSTGARETVMKNYERWILTPCRVDSRDGSVRQWGNGCDSVGLAKFADRPDIREIIAELKGRDLVCDCPLSQPCHADVLLDIANAEARAQYPTPGVLVATAEDARYSRSAA